MKENKNAYKFVINYKLRNKSEEIMRITLVIW